MRRVLMSDENAMDLGILRFAKLEPTHLRDWYYKLYDARRVKRARRAAARYSRVVRESYRGFLVRNSVCA